MPPSNSCLRELGSGGLSCPRDACSKIIRVSRLFSTMPGVGLRAWSHWALQETSYLGNGLPGHSPREGSGCSAPSVAAQGPHGPASPPSSPMGCWVHVPTTNTPMVAPGAEKGQRRGTERKQKPSRGARAGWARWPDRGPGGPKAQTVLPLPDRTRTRKPRDESVCKPAGGAL